MDNKKKINNKRVLIKQPVIKSKENLENKKKRELEKEKKKKELESKDFDYYLENLKTMFDRADNSIEEKRKINEEIKKIEQRELQRVKSQDYEEDTEEVRKKRLIQNLEKEKHLTFEKEKQTKELKNLIKKQLEEKEMEDEYLKFLEFQQKEIQEKKHRKFLKNKKNIEKILYELKLQRNNIKRKKNKNETPEEKGKRLRFEREVEKFKETIKKNSEKIGDFVLNFYRDKAYGNLNGKIFFFSDILENWDQEKIVSFQDYGSFLFPSPRDIKTKLTNKLIHDFRTDPELRNKAVLVTLKILYCIFGYKIKISKSKNKIKIVNKINLDDPEFQYEVEDETNFYKGGFYNHNNLELLKRILVFLTSTRITILSNLIFLMICKNMKDENIKKFVNLYDKKIINSWIESQTFLTEHFEFVRNKFIKSPVKRKSVDAWDDHNDNDLLKKYTEDVKKKIYLDSLKLS